MPAVSFGHDDSSPRNNYIVTALFYAQIGVFMEQSNVRKLTVYESSGYHDKPTSTIILKGQWLEKYGFSAGTKVDVKCQDGRLVIVPREEQGQFSE